MEVLELMFGVRLDWSVAITALWEVGSDPKLLEQKPWGSDPSWLCSFKCVCSFFPHTRIFARKRGIADVSEVCMGTCLVSPADSSNELNVQASTPLHRCNLYFKSLLFFTDYLQPLLPPSWCETSAVQVVVPTWLLEMCLWVVVEWPVSEILAASEKLLLENCICCLLIVKPRDTTKPKTGRRKNLLLAVNKENTEDLSQGSFSPNSTIWEILI